MEAHIVIGSNYGDEGKGAISGRLCKNNYALNILTNGGAQRGHTVVSPEGIRIVNSHLGSGTAFGADNFFAKSFILNPMSFKKEFERFPSCKIYRHVDCLWTTPFEMISNQCVAFEEKTHHTCGMGIWNTILSRRYAIKFDDFIQLSRDKKFIYLMGIKEREEVKCLDIFNIYTKFFSDKETYTNIINHYIEDCEFLFEHTIPVTDNDLGTLFREYDRLVFENGQGLLIGDPGFDEKNSTPSETGIKTLEQFRNTLSRIKIVAHYVTRPYITRHGDGFCENEINRKDLSSGVAEDATNVYNNFQGELRYGKLDIDSFKRRIDLDFSKVHDLQISREIDVTHCDELSPDRFKRLNEKVNYWETA